MYFAYIEGPCRVYLTKNGVSGNVAVFNCMMRDCKQTKDVAVGLGPFYDI